MGISNHPWKRGDGLFLSDITIRVILAPIFNANQMYPLISRRMWPTVAGTDLPGSLIEPATANLSCGSFLGGIEVAGRHTDSIRVYKHGIPSTLYRR